MGLSNFGVKHHWESLWLKGQNEKRKRPTFHAFKFPCTCNHKPQFVYVKLAFCRPISFIWVFLLQILSLCMVSIQECFIIKSGLWWGAYVIWNHGVPLTTFYYYLVYLLSIWIIGLHYFKIDIMNLNQHLIMCHIIWSNSSFSF